MSSSDSKQRVLVIGAGISGLAAAHRIVELQTGAHVELWEKQERVGGVLSTKHENGYQVEESADNFITTVPYGLALCKRLGLTDELVQTNPETRRTFVVRRGRLHMLPDGFLMMAPTKMWPLAVTPILSPLGKLRAAFEYFIPPRKDNEDESMASFGHRRLGREVFERLVEPLVSGVYGADMTKLSLLATLPRFREMEKEYGSMVRAMRKQMAERKRKERQAKAASRTISEADRQKAPDGGDAAQSGARHSMFVTLREGLNRLTGELVSRLPDGAVHLSRGVAAIKRENDAWQITDEQGKTDTFDAVILATPSYDAARLLEEVDGELASSIGSIEHTGTAIATVAFKREQIGHPLHGAGFVVPSIEKSPILACSFSSRKYPHRSPEGDVLIRIFAGGARAPEMATMDDQPLLSTLLEELQPLLKIKGDPHYTTVAHWPRTMPQYHVGHLDLIDRIESMADKHPGLVLAGNAYHGVGVPACIHSGEQAAEKVVGAE